MDVGDALHFAHGRGMVHRDVKPRNILLDSQDRPRLTDFDLVKAADTSAFTRTGAMGALLYAAPEQLEDAGRVDHRADVYSLGMTALFCLRGRDPTLKVIRYTPGIIDGMKEADALKDVLKRAVDWDVHERFATVPELCAALKDAWDRPVTPSTRRVPGARPVLSSEAVASSFTERLLDTLAERESMKSKKLAFALGVPVLDVRNELLELEKLGIVYRTGQTRGTRWWLG